MFLVNAGDSEVALLDELRAKVEGFRDGLRSAWEAIDRLEEQLEEERVQRRRVEAQNEDLRDQVEHLAARTDLLRLVENSDKLTAKQRSVALIQHLRRAAEKQRDRDRQAKASMNREEAERALQYPAIDRTTIYNDMRRAARLVDNQDVLRYVSASGGESRLRLSLEAGRLPGEITGQRTSTSQR